LIALVSVLHWTHHLIDRWIWRKHDDGVVLAGRSEANDVSQAAPAIVPSVIDNATNIDAGTASHDRPQ
jgi:hypothetical protein